MESIGKPNPEAIQELLDMVLARSYCRCSSQVSQVKLEVETLIFTALARPSDVDLLECHAPGESMVLSPGLCAKNCLGGYVMSCHAAEADAMEAVCCNYVLREVRGGLTSLGNLDPALAEETSEPFQPL